MTPAGDLIDVAGLRALLAAGGCRVVDCRFDLFDAEKGHRDYLQGHIPGAVHADMDRDLSSEITSTSGRHPLPDVEAFRDRLERWGISNDTRVVAYDYGNGSLAVRLWWMLRLWLGHERVSVLDGGFADWVAAGQAQEQAEPQYPRARFLASADPSVIATTPEIAAAIDSGRPMTVVDARDAQRFRGEAEPIDTVAGHVPGARNLPLADDLAPDGRWRAPSELAAVWRQALEGEPAQPVVVAMCGSGVTACHLILSARRAGLPAPRLYVGSWSEWIRDPTRPIATGE